jgi:TolA-binding protein
LLEQGLPYDFCQGFAPRIWFERAIATRARRLKVIKSVVAPLVLVLVILTSAAPASAQVESREGIALQNQMLELRRQVQTLQDQIARGGSNPPYPGRPPSPPQAGSSDLVTQLLSRVDALEEQVRQLRGRLDETQNQTQRQGADLNKRIDDMQFQLQGPPGPRAASTTPRPAEAVPPASSLPPGPPAIEAAPAAAPPPVRRTPELTLQEGNAALARRDYTGAEQSARQVLTGSRTSARAYDAQFLLAQALMGQHQYSQAAIAYDDTYNRARKGTHAPDALLGLANALIAINEKKAACDSLGKLRSEYPTLRPDIRDAATTSAQRAGCR